MLPSTMSWQLWRLLRLCFERWPWPLQCPRPQCCQCLGCRQHQRNSSWYQCGSGGLPQPVDRSSTLSNNQKEVKLLGKIIKAHVFSLKSNQNVHIENENKTRVIPFMNFVCQSTKKHQLHTIYVHFKIPKYPHPLWLVYKHSCSFCVTHICKI